jgi:hypothetical protein
VLNRAPRHKKHAGSFHEQFKNSEAIKIKKKNEFRFNLEMCFSSCQKDSAYELSTLTFNKSSD